jgi:hypothetical protein
MLVEGMRYQAVAGNAPQRVRVGSRLNGDRQVERDHGVGGEMQVLRNSPQGPVAAQGTWLDAPLLQRRSVRDNSIVDPMYAPQPASKTIAA